MKKKIIIFLFLILFCESIFPRLITKKEAITVSLKWIQNENHSKKIRLTQNDISFANISKIIFKEENIGYVVQLEPKGFIIISGISELSPIKFISFSGNYLKIKDHPFFQAISSHVFNTFQILGYYHRKAQLIHHSHKKQSIKLNKRQIVKNELAWKYFLLKDGQSSTYSILSEKTIQAAGPLLTTKWDQGYPYNIYTPQENGDKTVAGCVAIAMTQIMYFWKYPKNGQGYNTYKWNEQILYANFNHKYYWKRMKDSYGGSETHEQKDAIARLVSDVGISINMKYGSDGSSANINANQALIKNFKYSEDFRRLEMFDYNAQEMFQIISNQINNNWPIIASLYKEDDGHAVVYDGYRVKTGINQVHVNMGWNGASDNYYTLDNIASGWEMNFLYINIYPLGQLETKIVNPHDGISVNGKIDIWVNGNDDGDITLSELYVNNTLLYTTQNASYSYIWNTLDFSNTSHTIKAVAFNSNGEHTEDQITVDVFNLGIELFGIRKIEKTWLIQKEFGQLEIKIKETGPVSSLTFYLYRKEDDSEYKKIIEIPGNKFGHGNYIYYDVFLEKNKNYIYKATAESSEGSLIDISDEIIL